MKLKYLFLLMLSIPNIFYAQTYCQSGNGGNNLGSIDITDVKIYNDQNQLIFWNPSPCGSTNAMPGSQAGAYVNYTNMNIPFVRGKTYKIIHSSDGCTFPTPGNNRIAIYSDFNKNGSFFDAGDTIFLSNLFSTNPIGIDSGFFTIPNHVSVDSTRFRIVLRSYHPTLGVVPPPCTIFLFGETEDYTATFCDKYTYSLQKVDIACKGDTTGRIRVIDTGGRAPLMYRFDNNAYSPIDSIAKLLPGKHTVWMRDSVGCTYSDSIVILEPAEKVKLELPTLFSSCTPDSPIRFQLVTNFVDVSKSFYINDSFIFKNKLATFSQTFYPYKSYKLSVIDSFGCRVDSTILIDTLVRKNGKLTIDTLTCNIQQKGKITLSRNLATDTDLSFSIESSAISSAATLSNLNAGSYVTRHHQNRANASTCVYTDTVVLKPHPQMIDSFSYRYANCYFNDSNRVDLFFRDTLYKKFQWKRQYPTSSTGEVWEYQGDTANHMRVIDYEGWIDVLVEDPIQGCKDSMRFQFAKPSPKPTHQLTYFPLGSIKCYEKDTLVPTQVTINHMKSPVKFYVVDFDYYQIIDSGYSKDTLFSLPFKGAGKSLSIIFIDSLGCECRASDTFYKKSNINNTHISSIEPPSCFNVYNGGVNLNTTGVFPIKFTVNDTIIRWDSVPKKFSAIFIPFGNRDSIHIEVQDALGCVFDTIIKGIQNTFFNLDAKIQVENISCNGVNNGKIIITPPTTGLAPYSYSLDNQNYQTDNVFSNLSEGTYSVWVNDLNNCPNLFTATIERPTLLSISIIKDDIKCHGEKSGIVSVQAFGGKSPYQMTWNGQLFGALPATIYDLDSGSYTISLKDANNCAIDTFVLISTNPPILTTYTLDSIQCHNASDGKINIQSSGGKGNFQYSNNGINYSANAVFNNLNAGSFTFFSKDGAGCMDTVAISLQNPPAIAIQLIKKSDLTCFQKNDGKIEISYSGPHPPLRLKWNDNDTLAIRNNLMAGNYSATVSNAHNCKQSLAVTIMQADSFYILPKNIENVKCFGEKTGSIEIVSIGGQKPIQYRWSTGDTSTKIEKLKGATYYALTATDANGCAVKNQFFVGENPSLQGTIISKNITCFDGFDGEIKSQGLGGKPPYSYQLDSLQRGSKNIFRNLASKSFKIAIFDSNMCQWDTTLVLSSPPKPIMSLPNSYQVLLGESTLFVPVLNAYPYKNISYKWEPNYDLSCADCKETQFIGYQNNNYTFYVSYANNQCIDSANTSVLIKQDDKQRYYIPNAFSPLLPSAENKIFRVYGNYIKSIDLKVFNRWGEKVFESQSVENSWNGMYQGAPAIAGTYSYTATIEFLDKKIVKTNGFVILFW